MECLKILRNSNARPRRVGQAGYDVQLVRWVGRRLSHEIDTLTFYFNCTLRVGTYTRTSTRVKARRLEPRYAFPHGSKHSKPPYTFMGLCTIFVYFFFFQFAFVCQNIFKGAVVATVMDSKPLSAVPILYK